MHRPSRFLVPGLAVASFAIGTVVAITMATTRDYDPGLGSPPADMLATVSREGECVQFVNRDVSPPTVDRVSAVQGSGWLTPNRSFVGTIADAAKAFGAIDVREGTGTAWVRSATSLEGLVAFDVAGRTVWVSVMTVSKVACGS